MSIVGKICDGVWLKECFKWQGLIGEEQGGFRSGGGYVDQIFVEANEKGRMNCI